ncbi:metallophosphoesterase family protein [Puniceicoccus vermicola]|uniref:DNA repair exonuclease n=1 Tax=Puniceicoccus vermicola TaxID=388746 RepID=A0A7X1E4W1_9BACT|nr:DNA repair exonuclease [Puniceicoccus vermicola]MBC2601012.1 DNA repair exonuclease [Puniceicoccus vermicola]
MIRFIHTADWQMGMKASGLGQVSKAVRDARLDSIKRLVELGNDRDAELMLITGDIFEDNAVDRLLVRKVGQLLAGFNGKVFITPGNHDPLVPGSVWEHPVWEESANTTVVRENSPIELEHCTIYPTPLKEKYSTRNPVSWIQAQDCSTIAIGMSHGNVEGLPDVEPDFPIPQDAAERAGLDYLGIGHWHSYSPYKDGKGVIRIAYSGTHETTKFGERESGNVLLVEIADRGAAPSIEVLPTGKLSWHSLERSLESPGALKSVISELSSIISPENALVRLRLSGLLFASDREDLESIGEILQTRFLFGKLMADALSPAPEDDTWIEELPVGALREAAEHIRQKAMHAPVERDRAVATRALLELFDSKEKAAS